MYLSLRVAVRGSARIIGCEIVRLIDDDDARPGPGPGAWAWHEGRDHSLGVALGKAEQEPNLEKSKDTKQTFVNAKLDKTKTVTLHCELLPPLLEASIHTRRGLGLQQLYKLRQIPRCPCSNV